MAKCKTCFDHFDTIDELDIHLRDAHRSGPLMPKTRCPEGLEEASALLVESMMPDWVTQGDYVSESNQAKVEALLREWDTETVNYLLATLVSHGYVVRKRVGL